MNDAAQVALITPSYRGDYERCRLLCDSVDAHLQDKPHHYILVDRHDYDLFKPLAGPRCHIVNEGDILPSWLHDLKLPFSPDARKLWWSFRTWPLRGWHVQQLRRIAIASHVDAEGLLYCDSDMVFVKPFSTDALWKKGDLRLYRKPHAIVGDAQASNYFHKDWTDHAARLNGLSPPSYPAHDYINNLVSWRRDGVLAMCRHIEQCQAKHWVAAIASRRTFSECQIYGAYADGVLNGDSHWHAPVGLCRTFWGIEPDEIVDGDDLIAALSDEEVAIGVQSFIGFDTARLRTMVGLA